MRVTFDGRLQRGVSMKPHGHSKKIISGPHLMRQDEHSDAIAQRRLMVESTTDICGRSLLPPFKYKRADHADLGSLLLQPFMNVQLRLVQHKGAQTAALGLDL